MLALLRVIPDVRRSSNTIVQRVVRAVGEESNKLRRLIIGDIHGCYRELMELLDLAALADGDEIIAIGDIIDRGPASVQVLDFFRTHPIARCWAITNANT